MVDIIKRCLLYIRATYYTTHKVVPFVEMSFTQIDVLNGSLFTNNRTRLLILDRLYNTAPHLLSHCRYTIRRADPSNDFFFPRALENRAIVSDVFITESLCEKLSCNFAGPRGNCKPNDEAYNYLVGDSAVFQTACEPACFNLLRTQTYNDDGVEYPHMSRLTYADNRCVFAPGATIWAEVPLYRSTEIFETRVNDLPAGFNRRVNPTTVSQIGYEYNETFCRSFFDTWDPTTRTCITPWYRMIANVVVGEMVIKMVKAGITALQNDGNSIPPPIGLPPVPPINPRFWRNNWIQDVNTEFILPDPNGDASDIVNTAYVFSKPTKRTPRKSIPTETLPELAPAEIDDEFFVSSIDKVMAILEFIFTDPEFIASIGVDIVVDMLLSGIRKITKAAMRQATPVVNALLRRVLTTPLPSRVFAVAFRATMTRMVAQVAIKVASQFLLALGRIVVLASSVVGIILIIISVFDIVLSFWDPLGFNNKYPPGFLDDLMRNSDLALRQQFGMSIPQITFDGLSALLLTEEEIITINLQSFEWMFEYFNALEINSEGSRINRGRDISLGNDLERTYDHAMARLVIPTQRDFMEFEIRHATRWRLSKTANAAAWVMAGGVILLVAFKLNAAALIVVLITVVLFAISMINLDTDAILDTLPKESLDWIFSIFPFV